MVVENASLRREVGHERRIRHEVLGRLDESAIDVLRECPRCGACFDRGIDVCPTDGAELMPTLPVGRTIAGKYRLERLIGRGGMGSVYEATDLGIGRLVAVKVLRAQAFGNETSTRRFRREARILGAISQRNIVTVHDYGTVASGSAFLVMERLHGATWRTALRDRGCIPPRELAAWVEQLCDALIAAHANGVVHRDLKPENVIIIRRPEGSLLKVLDFGLAKQLDADGETEGLSVAGAVMGTPGYMSPEQLAGRSVDHRADVFAVAVMVWEALSGEKPFDGSTPRRPCIGDAPGAACRARRNPSRGGPGPQTRHGARSREARSYRHRPEARPSGCVRGLVSAISAPLDLTYGRALY